MSRIPSTLAFVLILTLAACASDGGNKTARKSQSVECGPGQVLQCEVRNTGRIKHGSFAKGNTRCSCEDGRAGPTIIPSVNQPR